MNTILSELCDERLIERWNNLEMDCDCLSDAVAEDEGERARFGDGPCGSMDRRFALSRVNKDLDECRKEWYRRYPQPVPPVTPDNEIPF